MMRRQLLNLKSLAESTPREALQVPTETFS
jgi:hypothetical protein